MMALEWGLSPANRRYNGNFIALVNGIARQRVFVINCNHISGQLLKLRELLFQQIL